MSKYLAKLSIWFVILITLMGCGDGSSGRSRTKKNRGTPATLPVKGAKIAFIFPAGAGAMRVILGITEALEKDLGIQGLGVVADVAGGVSSGSLVASALTVDKTPKITSKDLKAQMGDLVSTVFPHTKVLVDRLMTDYNFTLSELEAIFLEIMKAPPDLSSPASATAGLETIMINAGKSAFGIKSKIDAKGSIADFMAAIAPLIVPMAGFDSNRTTILTDHITKILGDTTLSDPTNSKMLAFATGDGKPVFFGPSSLAKFVSGPFAVGTTKLHKALVASSAIPSFIKAPSDIDFIFPDGTTKNIPDLKDGFFATEGKFDPSATFYEIFSKQFAGDDVLMVFVGNGADIDAKFRAMLRNKFGFNNKISQGTTAQGKQITYVAIDANIKDDNGKKLFNLSSFYYSKELAGFMDKAAEEAIKSKAYDWTLKALKAAMK